MAGTIETILVRDLDRRRRELGLSYEVLAQRCGVSRPTLQRILSGRHRTARFANIVAIASALGFDLKLDSRIDPRDLKRTQAERKAKKLVGIVQGTSALEGQALDASTLEALVEETTHKLLAGPNRRLWSEE